MVDTENSQRVLGYPECKNAKPIVVTVKAPCPVCGSAVQVRKTKRGKKYYICENNPKSCNYISWNEPKVGETWTPDQEKEAKRKTTRKKTTTTKKRASTKTRKTKSTPKKAK